MSEVDDKFWQEGHFEGVKDLKTLLEKRANTFIPMEGFKLKLQDFSRINLVNRGFDDGFVFNDCDFYKADFENAHCYKVDFAGCSLMKTNFRNANLHHANLENCNLLGTIFERAKLENVHWGEAILQERLAKKEKVWAKKKDYYQQAEEIYRNLRRTTEDDGLFETSGRFFRKEMIMRRKQMPKYSLKRYVYRLVDVFCGYGELPFRIILFSMFFILTFAVLYSFSGVSFSGEILKFDFSKDIAFNIDIFFNCLYFSVVTFTTLGYGDITPVGISRLFATSEALSGGFILALFVVMFNKKMTR